MQRAFCPDTARNYKLNMDAVQFNVVSDGTGELVMYIPDDDNKVGPCNTLDSSSDLGISIKT